MHNHKIQTQNKQIRFVTNLGIAANLILFVLKTIVGLAAGSIALVADGIHSLSDMATDIAVILGIHFGSKQPDEKHPYGHGRIETFAAVFIGVVLAIVGGAMIYRAGTAITAGKTVKPGFVVLWIALASIIAKELLYRMTRAVAVKSHSPALYANAWHHRSDALSSVVVVIGFVSLQFGFEYGDQIAAVGVGLMIILVAVHVIIDCIGEFTEAAIDTETIDHIKSIIGGNRQIRQWHRLRTRMVGREIFLDLHILVDPDLNVAAAHGIAEDLESTLHEEISRPVNVIVHIEPDTPEMRR